MRIFILFLLMYITRWFYIGEVGMLYRTCMKHQLLIHLYLHNTIVALKKIYQLYTQMLLPIAQRNTSTLYK